MNLKHKACTLLFLLLSISTYLHAAGIPKPSGAPPTANAYFLDTVLWPYDTATKCYEIPVCWESSSQSTAAQRTLVRDAVANTWQKYSLVNF